MIKILLKYNKRNRIRVIRRYSSLDTFFKENIPVSKHELNEKIEEYYQKKTTFVNSYQHFNRISVRNKFEYDDSPPKDFNIIVYESENCIPIEGSLVEVNDEIPKIGLVIRRALSRFDERYNKLLVLTSDNELIQVSPQDVIFHLYQVKLLNYRDIVNSRYNLEYSERIEAVNFLNAYIDDALEMKRSISLDIVYSQIATSSIKPISLTDIVDALKFKESRVIQITSSYYYQCVLLQSIHWNLIDSCKWIVPNAIPNYKTSNLFNNFSNSFVKTEYFINSQQNWQSIQQYLSKQHTEKELNEFINHSHDEKFLNVYEGRHSKYLLDVMKFARLYPHNSLKLPHLDGLKFESQLINKGSDKFMHLRTRKYYQDQVIYGIPLGNVIIGVSIEAINSRKYVLNIHIPDISTTLKYGKFSEEFIKSKQFKNYQPSTEFDEFMKKPTKRKLSEVTCMTISFKYNTFDTNIFDNHEISISFDSLSNLNLKIVDSDLLEKCLSGKLQSNIYNLIKRNRELTKLDLENLNYVNGVLKHFFKLRQHNGASIPGVFDNAKFFHRELKIFAGYLTTEYCLQNQIPVNIRKQDLAARFENDKVVIQHDNIMLPDYEADNYHDCIIAKDAKSFISPMAYIASMNYLKPEIVDTNGGRHLRLGLPNGYSNITDAINKYYPPDYDPSKIPKIRKPKNGTIKIRMMIPFSMRCTKCNEYIAERRSINAKKEVTKEKYLNIKIIRFTVICPGCNNTITFKTDPKNASYTTESGAVRNYESKKSKNETEDDLLKRLEVEEIEDQKFKLKSEKRKFNKFWNEKEDGNNLELFQKRLEEQHREQMINQELEQIEAKSKNISERADLVDLARGKLEEEEIEELEVEHDKSKLPVSEIKQKLQIPTKIKIKKKAVNNFNLDYSSDSD
ncbi:unnamed protein product [Candida verbasci]|uniref:Splicing factor YJU2 n=1 Tax=Candida verbasci TaxID=1227364 RepID=A0A9W4X7T4_9ASCO|nr:unnamed protein product [Candida verbasci]